MDDEKRRFDWGYISLNGLTRFQGKDIIYKITNPRDLDELIAWRLEDGKYTGLGKATRGSEPMQRQWTIEARADFQDEGKYLLINEEVRKAGVILQAKLDMIMENNIKPKVACGSDDWFMGHKEIDMLAAQIDKETLNDDNTIDAVSSELLQAARDAQSEKPKA